MNGAAGAGDEGCHAEDLDVTAVLTQITSLISVKLKSRHNANGPVTRLLASRTWYFSILASTSPNPARTGSEEPRWYNVFGYSEQGWSIRRKDWDLGSTEEATDSVIARALSTGKAPPKHEFFRCTRRSPPSGSPLGATSSSSCDVSRASRMAYLACQHPRCLDCPHQGLQYKDTG